MESRSGGWWWGLVSSTLVLAAASAAEQPWHAVVSPDGMVEIDRDGHTLASLRPALFEVEWKQAVMEEGKYGQQVKDGVHRGVILAPGGTPVDVELRVEAGDSSVKFDYRLTPRADIRLNSLHVGLSLPTRTWAGGTFEADGKPETFPKEYGNAGLRNSTMHVLKFATPAGESLQLDFTEPAQVLVQDDRLWDGPFSVRIGTATDSSTPWPAGKTCNLGFTLSGNGGVALEKNEPVTIAAGPGWLPLDVALDIEPGSALDFSTVIKRDMPAGKSGRVTVDPQGRFTFENSPAKTQRFYGINLCFTAQFLDPAVADRLAERLWRLGYNALRIHHYEGELIDRSGGAEIRFLPGKLEQLDYLFAALKKRGIYMTTDLFVSRPVPANAIYPEEKGDLGMDEYKMAVLINDKAYANYKSFASTLLEHTNPHTGFRYADDPALAWLCLVNEGNPGNFISRLKGPLHDDWQRAWNAWLARRYPDRTALANALGTLPAGQDPGKGNIPLQDVHSARPISVVFNVFLAETERDFFKRTRKFLREEIGCKALLTNMNAWTNPVQIQAVRTDYDYVDDHFYVDHPKFLEKPWQLPSSCPNTSPVAEGAPGGTGCAFTRLFGKPFTITEFNYSSPGRFRGVGGILTGAMAAIQDWDGLWRFSYAHNRENVSGPGALNYFDVSTDPLNQAAERASLCLFLRGDLQPAAHSVAISASTAELLDSPATSHDKTPPWRSLAWMSRVGWRVTDDPEPVENQLTLPLGGGKLDPFSNGAGDSVIETLLKRNLLPEGNRSNSAQGIIQSENGGVTIDAPNDTLTLDTARTAGGFAPAGKRIKTRAADIEILDTDATVWVSSLDSNAIPVSGRLLITHLTDLQNSGARYSDRKRKVLLAWGRLPHLVQTGRANITLHLEHPEKAKVFGLSTGGKRLAEIPATASAKDGTLVIQLSTDANGKARMLYEVTVGN